MNGMAMTPTATRLLAGLRHQLLDPPTPLHRTKGRALSGRAVPPGRVCRRAGVHRGSRGSAGLGVIRVGRAASTSKAPAR